MDTLQVSTEDGKYYNTTILNICNIYNISLYARIEQGLWKFKFIPEWEEKYHYGYIKTKTFIYWQV